MSMRRCAVLLVLGIAAVAAAVSAPMPEDVVGDWVPAGGSCDATTRLRVESQRMTLVNGSDQQSWGDLETALTFFGPEYDGISTVVMPDFDSGDPPFTVYFNADEKKGVTKVEIYVPMQGNTNAQVAAIQAKHEKLAKRFPGLNMTPLKRCAATK
ncbi:MAG: hypothetical protein KIT14_21190 [bacterium]|nr:hypothetical protein [bacterium]